jgi:hypothetical protein
MRVEEVRVGSSYEQRGIELRVRVFQCDDVREVAYVAGDS